MPRKDTRNDVVSTEATVLVVSGASLVAVVAVVVVVAVSAVAASCVLVSLVALPSPMGARLLVLLLLVKAFNGAFPNRLVLLTVSFRMLNFFSKNFTNNLDWSSKQEGSCCMFMTMLLALVFMGLLVELVLEMGLSCLVVEREPVGGNMCREKCVRTVLIQEGSRKAEVAQVVVAVVVLCSSTLVAHAHLWTQQ